MKKLYQGKSSLILAFFILMCNNISLAQFKIISDQSELNLNGKATQHKWSAKADELDGSLNATMIEGKLSNITYLEILVTSNQIHSGKSGMDERMHKALKAGVYSKIIYKHSSEKIEGNKIMLTGELTIAGVSRTINTIVEFKLSNGKIHLNGIFTLKMTDYNIEPPEFMFGSLKTGDDVIIKFTLVFQ